MEIGVGLPNTVAGVTRDSLLEWARRSESAGFSTLGTLDRLVYPNIEPLIALAAAAAVTERIRLTTDILLVPQRINAALLAKQAMSVHSVSGGRLVLGLGVGLRQDDYEASGAQWEGRGRRFEEMLDEMKRIWAGEEKGTAGPVGPPSPDGPPPLLIAGAVDATFRRAAEYADGWTASGGTPDQFADGREKLLEAWRDKGREGEPRTCALAYFALGENAEEAAHQDLTHYYAWLGDDLANQIAASAATDAETVKGYIEAFEGVGADELIFFPASTDPEQVDLLADAGL